MDAFVAARDEARKRLTAADHILTQTYPLLRDPKLLLAVLQHLHEALESGMLALLGHEAGAKRIPTVPEDRAARLSLFRQHVVPRYGVPNDFLRLMGEVRETLEEHRKSPVEFVRKGEFVICDEGYRVRTLTVEQLKRHLVRAKAFLGFMEEKVNRNDAIIARRH